MKNNNKRAFTLAEMLITMCIVGVLAVIVLPVLNNVFPNQEKMMFKKAYYLTEKVVSELVNDEDLYPEIENDQQKPYLGNTVEVTYKGNKYSGDTKFCELFAARVNTASDIDCSSHSFSNNSVASSYTFKTSDGIVWDLPISSFSSETSPAVIQIDVNGPLACIDASLQDAYGLNGTDVYSLFTADILFDTLFAGCLFGQNS